MARLAVVWGCILSVLAFAGCSTPDQAVKGLVVADAKAQADGSAELGAGPDAIDAAAPGVDVLADVHAIDGVDAGPAPDLGVDASDAASVVAKDGDGPDSLGADTTDAGVAPDVGLPCAVTVLQQAYIKASNTNANDLFGSHVAVDGDTLVVGAPWEDGGSTGAGGEQGWSKDSGAAYVLVRQGGVWKQSAYLKASNTGTKDDFGTSVAISGDTIVVGADAEDSKATGVDGNQADNSATDSGAAYVFVRQDGKWTQQAYLKASNTTNIGYFGYFGTSVGISGDTVVVGAFGESSAATGVDGKQSDTSAYASGAAYVFVRKAGKWTQQAYLKASNTEVKDNFASSVAISGDTIVAGASAEGSKTTGVNGDQVNDGAAGSGAAYVFVREDGLWTQQAYLKASNTGAGDAFGAAVAVSGDSIVVGAANEASKAAGVNGDQQDNSFGTAGAAYVFVRHSATWSQQAYLKASNPFVNAYFGHSVAIAGQTIVVGAYGDWAGSTGVDGAEDNCCTPSSGAAYVFERESGIWTQRAFLKASNPESGDLFGFSVGIGSHAIVVGAEQEASNAKGVGGDQADNSAPNSGAVYAFLLDDGCDDGNPCTDDACAAGKCLHTNNAAPCDDGNPCTSDVCAAGKCVSSNNIAFCDDGNACTTDACLAGACTHAFNSLPCDDGLACTVGDACADGKCAGTPAGCGCPSASIQQAYVKPLITNAGANFGDEVAIDGDTMVVGASFPGGSCAKPLGSAVYVFVRQSGVWLQQAWFPVSGPWNFAVSGDTIVIGQPSDASKATGVNGDSTDTSAPKSGAALVYVRKDGKWTQQAYLKASNTGVGDDFGWSTDISGDTIVVGADSEASSATGVGGNQADDGAKGSGAAYVFVRSGTGWSQQAYLKASNTGAGEKFGHAAGISGDTIVVGAIGENSKATGVGGDQTDHSAAWSGAAYVFVREGSVWKQQAYLKASDAASEFAWYVNISGDTVVASSSQAAYVFVRQAGIWSQQALLQVMTPNNKAQTIDSVSISNDTLVLGIGSYDVPPNLGAAYIWKRTGAVWNKAGTLKASNEQAFDWFGSGVSVSGDTIVVGADREDSGAVGIGGNQADNSAVNAGAVYVFAPEPLCDDGNVCTADACTAGACTHAFTGLACEDGNSCTTGDVCGNGACLPGELTSCDDGDVCTTDFCAGGKCVPILNKAPCDDGIACTTGDACLNGKCLGMPGICECLPSAALQQAYVKASNTDAWDKFGYSVAIDGDTMVVGSIYEASKATGIDGDQADNSASGNGAVYVFVREGAIWKQQAYLKSPIGSAAGHFGAGLAISGDTLVVGAAAGSNPTTFVFVRQKGIWSLEAQLQKADGSFVFGDHVAISGDHLAVRDGIFARKAGVWSQEATLPWSDTVGIGISGDTVALGIDPTVQVFVHKDGVWGKQATLQLNAKGYYSNGLSVSVSGDTIVAASSATAGAHVFVRTDGAWTEQAILKPASAGPLDIFGDGLGSGGGVAVFGDTVVVGAYAEMSDGTATDGQSNECAALSGAAYVFARKNGTWTEQAFLKASNAYYSANFGNFVAVSGATVVVGSDQERSNATGIGGDQANVSASDSGAAYVFALNPGCDDDNPCTDDACAAGKCLHTNNTAPCPGGTCSGVTCK